MNNKHSILESFVKGRFSLLLFTMALMFFAGPLIPANQVLLEKVVGLLGLAVLASCLRAISSNRRFFIFMVVLSLANVVLGSTEIFSNSDTHLFQTVVLGLRLTFYLLAFVSIMGYVVDSSPVTTDKICGTISAYILMGIIWAVVYSMFYHFNSRSFALPDNMQPMDLFGMWSLYFSFTTLTTLGYGDITPQIPAVQSYALMEAACGQVFLTVLVARLVALQILHSQKK